MYSISGYGDMIGDAVRMDAYAAALRQSVKPGAVVLDIGCGTGIFALLACQLGARRVFAVEPSDAIGVAREIAADNGFAASIEFIQGLSTEISLPERADVVVSDLRGVLPLHGRHLPAIEDARQRHLAPGGALIPREDSLWAACVEAHDLHASIAKPWVDGPFGLDMRAAQRLVANQWCRARVEPSQLLSEPRCWGRIDYRGVADTDLGAAMDATVRRPGTGHGLCAWFDATLGEGIRFSNAPGNPATVYANAFFPWPEPLGLEAGDKIAVELHAKLVGEDYVWRWRTRVMSADSRRCKAQFEQSTFYGEPLSATKLRKHSPSHVASLSEEGNIDRLSLEMMHRGAPLGEVARFLAREFPQRFESWQDAMSRVGELSARYGR